MRKGLPMCPRGTGQACCLQCCVSERSNRSNRVSRPQQTSWTRCPHTQRESLQATSRDAHSCCRVVNTVTALHHRRGRRQSATAEDPCTPSLPPPALLPTSSSSLRPCPWEPVIPALRRALGSPGLQCCSPHCLFRVYRWNS